MEFEMNNISAEAEKPSAQEAVEAAEETAVTEPSAEPQADESTEEATIEQEAPEEETIGNIKISVDVVSTIAGIAASEIEGVSCMYTSFAEGFAKRLGARKNASNGVKVDMSGDNVGIDLYIVVEYGIKIPELAWSVQENVKNSVETMTGLPVSKVNIHIEGISFGTEDEAEPSLAEITE